MIRGYRSVIVAALGCLILAGPAEGEHKQGQQRQAANEDHHGSTAAPFVKPPVGSDLRQPDQEQCISADNERETCSRASAQATVDQARYALWQALAGGLGVVIGIGTLVAAFLAAKWAKAAAIHTEAGAQAARNQAAAASKSLRSQIASSRPLMIFDTETAFFQAPPFDPPWDDPSLNLMYNIKANFSFKNIGDQPCWIVSAWLTFIIKDRDYVGITSDSSGNLILADGLPDWFRVANAGFVQPGQSIDCGRGFYGIGIQESEIIKRGGGAAIHGMCQYRGLSGDLFCTRYAYHIRIHTATNKGSPNCWPVANAYYWRDGFVKAPKLDHPDLVEWTED